MVSVILLSMLIILPSTQVWLDIWSVATTRIDFWTWHLIEKTLWTGAGSGLLISMLEKLMASFDRSKNTGAIDLKMDGSVLEEKSYFKMLG